MSDTFVAVFANYEGGRLVIDVDVDRPNIKIGVVSYESVEVTLVGTYADRVTAVEYAGYDQGSNTICGGNIPATQVSGVAPTVVNIAHLPPVTLTDPSGYSAMICAYSCSNGTNQGGCNTEAQVQHYFESIFGPVCQERIQFGCWSSPPGGIALSSGSTCPL